MTLQEIYKKADELAPFALSKEWIEKGAYDNSGIIVDIGGEINKVLFALDLTKASFEAAKRVGADCIVTHHPAIYAPIRSLGQDSLILMCAKSGISVLSAHLNLDAAKGGIDESLMEGLGGKSVLAIMQTLQCGGYGRVYDVKEQSLEELKAHAEREFSTKRVLTYGNAPVKRIASFCGGGFDEEAIAFALEHGADTLCSSDSKHHLITGALESGLNILLFTHYASEQYGFHRFFLRMREALSVPCEYFAEERFL